MDKYRQLFDSNKNRVFNTALSFVYNRQDAEDITQEVFLKVFEAYDSFNGRSSASTWIYRITINTCIDFLNAKKATKRKGILVRFFGGSEGQQAENEISHFVHPGIILEQKDNARMLFKAVDLLSYKEKTVYILAKIEGLSHAKIADVMKLSIPSVESILFRANTNLRAMLQKMLTNNQGYE